MTLITISERVTSTCLFGSLDSGNSVAVRILSSAREGKPPAGCGRFDGVPRKQINTYIPYFIPGMRSVYSDTKGQRQLTMPF